MANLINKKFYAKYEDVSKEIYHYRKFFANKIVYCCNNELDDAFVKFFLDHFNDYCLKKLYVSQFNEFNEQFTLYEITKQNDKLITKSFILKGNGSYEFITPYIKQSDIITTSSIYLKITNFLACLMKYKKQFLIITLMQHATNTTIFKYFKDNLIFFGYSKVREFFSNLHTKKINEANCVWFTNFDVTKPLINYDYLDDTNELQRYHILNINSANFVPSNYAYLMAVPISYLMIHNQKQFALCGLINWAVHDNNERHCRILIKNKLTSS